MKFNMDEIEKIRILYNSLPITLQNRFWPTKEMTLEEFLEETQYAINFRIYALNATSGTMNKSFINTDDYMNIDNVDSSEKDISYFSHYEYCYILEKFLLIFKI